MITTHVLDISTGKPAAGIHVVLMRMEDGRRIRAGAGITNADGRLEDLIADKSALQAGVFELTFETGTYFVQHGSQPFHPRVLVTVEITDPAQNYHVPLLISPYGYTTYRGS